MNSAQGRQAVCFVMGTNCTKRSRNNSGTAGTLHPELGVTAAERPATALER